MLLNRHTPLNSSFKSIVKTENDNSAAAIHLILKVGLKIHACQSFKMVAKRGNFLISSCDSFESEANNANGFRNLTRKSHLLQNGFNIFPTFIFYIYKEFC